MAVESTKTEFSIFGILDGKETCLATAGTLMEISGKFNHWKHAVIRREYTYTSLEIRRVERATIRTSTFVLTVKEE